MFLKLDVEQELRSLSPLKTGPDLKGRNPESIGMCRMPLLG
ncbi:hypothetical protein [Deinococcus sp. RM]